MNNEIQIKGNTSFMGVEVPNLEGGFGEGQKVMLAKTIAEIHEVEIKEINKLINNNLNEFEFGIDILDLKTGYYKEPVLQNGLFTNAQWGNAKNIYLLSEQGYMLLVGFMKTKKAKEIRKKLRREYFAMREIIKTELVNKDKLVLDIYYGGTKAIESAKELVEIETEERTKVIKDGNDKVLTCGQVVNQL
ncbi:MAG: ORF6N domain-containing protein, partial [Bacilli bacterium]